MKALVFKDVGEVSVEEVENPVIRNDYDAIVKITLTAICGTDLHMVRGTMPGMKKGTVLGHEGVGVVAEVGKKVRNFAVGDRVIIPSTIACGFCVYCRSGYFAQCDNANPNGKLAGTSFYGGPSQTGPFQGLQAEKAVIPFANTNLVKIPDDISDEQAILLSDVFPTGYFAAELAEITPGDTVAVFGCGPVGQFAIASAFLKGASRVIAIDEVESRLEIARSQGAEIINFAEENPVEIIRELTGEIGVDRSIDAVGVDAYHSPLQDERANEANIEDIAEDLDKAEEGGWHPGDAPLQVLEWAVEATCKAGTLGIVGVYPLSDKAFPIGKALNKNLTIKMGNCNHRKYIPKLLRYVKCGMINPEDFITKEDTFAHVTEAYHSFDKRAPGWTKVAIQLND